MFVRAKKTVRLYKSGHRQAQDSSDSEASHPRKDISTSLVFFSCLIVALVIGKRVRFGEPFLVSEIICIRATGFILIGEHC